MTRAAIILASLALASCGGRSVTPDLGINASADAISDGQAAGSDGGLDAATVLCVEGFTLCGDDCVDLATTPWHCGGCDVVCDESLRFACVAGRCACAGGLSECDGVCVDLRTDLDHCGACRAVCSLDMWPGWHDVHCEKGVCAHSPLKDCAGAVVDTPSDIANCGDCGVACGIAEVFVCVGGVCSCVANKTDCGGQCVNRLSDSENCGVCGLVCTGGKVCAGGNCVCPPELPEDCGGTCANLQTDEENCGACGNTCPGIGGPCPTSCGGGHCGNGIVPSVVVDCPKTTIPCGTAQQCTATTTLQDGTTADVTADPNNTWSATALAGATCVVAITEGQLSVTCPDGAPCVVEVHATREFGTPPCTSTDISPVVVVTVTP